MALTVVTSPANYNMSKNPIPLELSTTSYYIEGTKAAAAIFFDVSSGNYLFPDGFDFWLTWGGASFPFIFVQTGFEYDQYKLPVKSPSMSDDEYFELLVHNFQSNHLLFNAFEIFLTKGFPDPLDYFIYFKARYTGTYYNFTFPIGPIGGLSIPSGITFVYNLEAGTDSTSPTANYSMVAQTLIRGRHYNDQVLDPLGNKCLFNFETIIDTLLEYDLPTYNSSLSLICLNVKQQISIRYYEKYGTTLTTYAANTIDFTVIKGGVSSDEFSTEGSNIVTRFSDTGKFLTRQPRIKKVRQAQQEYLYFLKINYNQQIIGGDVFKIKVTIKRRSGITVDLSVPITYTDLSSGSLPFSELLYVIPGPLNDALICFPVGFSQLNLGASVPWDDVFYYKVSIQDKATDDVLSEEVTYYADDDSYIDETTLYFTNSYGGFDTVRFTGDLQKSIKAEFETVESTRLFNTPLVTGQIKNVSHEKTNSFKINSGFLTKAEADWLEDLFVAEKVFLEAGCFLPIVIKTNTIKKYSSTDGKTAFEFEYYHSIPTKVGG